MNSRPPAKAPQPPVPLTSNGARSTAAPHSSSRSRTSSPSTGPVRARLATGTSGSSSNNNDNHRCDGAGCLRGLTAWFPLLLLSCPRNLRRSSAESPADEEGRRDQLGDDSPHDEWVRESNATIATMEKQLHQQLQDATSRNQKNQTRYTNMRATIEGKDGQIDGLRQSYKMLTKQLEELESFCNSDLDASTLDEVFMSLPADQRPVFDDLEITARATR